MSISTVRGAIAAYLNTAAADGGPAPIPSLNRIYRAMPTWIDPKRWWELPGEVPYGTVGFLHIARDDEDRIALPAVEGVKMVGYTVALMLLYKYKIPTGDGVEYEGDEWVDGIDACLEGVKALIRADPHLGTADDEQNGPGVIRNQFPDAIWQAGQDKGDLSHTSDLPALDSDAGEVISFQVLEFHAYEVITA